MTVQVAQFTVAGRGPGPAGPSIAEQPRQYTVIYDGDCTVCGRMVKLLRKWDRNRQLEIIPSQKPGVRERFPWIPARAYAESLQVVRTRDGKTWQSAAALRTARISRRMRRAK